MPNDNSTQRETLSYEAHVLQEILKINELMIRQAHLNEEFHGDDKFSPKNYKISKDENNSSADRFDNEAREIHFQVTSKNISSPKGRNISSSTTVFKIRSRTTLRNARFERNKFSESVDSSETDRTPASDRTFILTKNDQSLKVDELDILRSTMHENCANSTVRGENEISSTRVRKMEDRSIGDALFSCPFELVEIYSNKNKGKNSENNLNNLAFDVSRQTCSMRTFPKEGDKQFKIEKNQLSVSKEETCVDNGKDGGVKDSDKVDEICRKIYTKEIDQSDDLQKECRKENCQNRNETVEEECALNNSLINKDFHVKRHAQNNEDSQKKRREENDEINEDFQKTEKILKNNISETTVVKLIQDQENSIINSRIANDGTMQINKQNQLDENVISTSKKAEAKQDVNLITIYEATGKPCTEKTREENDFNKSEVTDETRKCNIKQSDDPSTFENNIKLEVKLEESCVRNDGLNITEDTRSLERKKDTNKEKEVVPTIKKQTSELKSANILSIPCSLRRVAKNHDLFVNEKTSKSLKFSDSANNATIKIEEGASEEMLRRDIESIPLSQTLCASNAEKSCAKIDNLNASEHTDYSKFHKLTDKVEENVSSTFKQENSQSVKKCLRSNLNAGSRKSNAFGSSSSRPKAEGNTSFKFKGGNRSTGTKCQKMNSDIDPRKSRVIDDNFFKQHPVNPNERKTSKTMTQHSESDDLKDSSSNLSSSLEDVHRQGKVSNAEERHANEDLSTENKIKIIVEKRESKENKVISGNKNLLCNEDIQSSMIKNERIEERDSDDSYEEVEINDAKHETAMRESRRIGINYKDLNVCKMLTKIHERLTSDWQRMEQLRMKLQISVSVELVNPMMMLQLLDKTIARCKSYIHGSNNSYETELQMAKLLSKYVVELVKIVKINRKSLEDQ
ncbi:unnamed protein product, partial [Heterotrigona itama]